MLTTMKKMTTTSSFIGSDTVDGRIVQWEVHYQQDEQGTLFTYAHAKSVAGFQWFDFVGHDKEQAMKRIHAYHNYQREG